MILKKQVAHNLIDAIPDEKTDALITILFNFNKPSIPTENPDAWDLQMLCEIANEKDETSITFEKALAEAGLTLNDLQN
ncbi:MAG: hypothetical protein LBS62_06995 [Clostridiales bacterium]|jgi:hypothetical protein|nr:hypothetical protein [Clostridiales bacterium]